MEAALLDDAILQHPGLAHLILEIQVRGVDARPGQLSEQAGKIIQAEPAGRHQSFGYR